MATSQNRRGLIAKIKIGQTQLGLDDATYRALLERVTGHRSCTEMDVGQLESVLAAMRSQGFTPTSPTKHKRPSARTSADPMLRKVGALLADNKLPWNYAHGMARKMFRVDRVQWLNDEHMHKLIAALQIYANRRKD
ncbi:gp16 family protein [Snodgrassella sp. CFCC 13594]|uniref:gp16 family protein n=1 Tax=Snodgrassella sp. CFCC 13594 TaxID=1775559 RepID=UPI00082E142E|nr:phage protein GemA/Gp16 family protein [Snodgrassella sp. CFCC 13594]